jgi:hypothetical protein
MAVQKRPTCGAPLLLALIAAGLICCSPAPRREANSRDPRARPGPWVSRIDSRTYEMSFDRNGDGRVDLTRIYRDKKIARVEHDRNLDGKVDLVQVYSQGVLVREIHDDNFDGRPESIKTFRPDGTLAIIERDPQERGYVTIAEYFDKAGKLLRRETRSR